MTGTPIPLGAGDWQSVDEDIPRIRLRNMYLIKNPASPDGVSFVSRPTLTELTSLSGGQISGMWKQDGTFFGDWLVVAGVTLYRVTEAGVSTELGNVFGTGFCQFAGTEDRVLIVREGTAYSTDGATVTTVVMPDDLPVGSVASLNSSFLLSVLGSDRFYWILPGETDPDSLDFATAERAPDPITSINIVSDEIWLLGLSGPEVWTATGDVTTPYQRVAGRVYSEGCAFRDTAIATVKNSYPALMWVTDTRNVVLAQGAPTKVSDESVDELLKSVNTLRAWSFNINRHDFYVLTSESFTLAYDIDMNKWSRWDSSTLDYWRAHLGLQSGSTSYAGDSESGTLYRLSEGITDDGEEIVHQIGGAVNNPGNPYPCKSVVLRLNAGWSPSYDYEPYIEMRYSDDQGATFSIWMPTSMGVRGRYSEDVVYRSLGLVKRPGRYFEFRFSGPARIRIDYALMNEV